MLFSLEPLDEDSIQSSMAKRSSENGSDDVSYQPLSQVKIKKVEDDNSKGNKRVSKPKAEKSLFDMNVAGALDRNKISDREAVRLIIPIAAALGHDPAALPLSRSSVKQKEARQNFSIDIKSKLDIKEPILYS